MHLNVRLSLPLHPSRLLLALLVFFTGSVIQGSLAAQQIAASQTVQTAAARAKLSTRITLRAENMRLESAIAEIAKQAGMGVLRRADGLSLDTRVTINIRDITVVHALAAATRGTNVSAEIASDGETITLAAVRGNRGSTAQGVIAGKVTEAKTGKAVLGATVSIGGDARSTTTGEDGSYRLTGINPGTHVVSVRLVGYAKQLRSVTVGEGATVTADFKLDASANVLDQVIVTGTIAKTELKAVPNAITVITAKDIEKRGITRIDQLFRGEVPGLFALQMGTTNSSLAPSLNEVVMYSRGATKLTTNSSSPGAITNAIKTYVDGVEMADPQYLSQIDPKSIERIEILTGPQASTIYGANAINGVMQVFTKRGSTQRPSLTLSLAEGFANNNFSSARATSHEYDGSVSGLEGKLSYNAGGGWDYTGSWSPGQQMQRTSIYGAGRYQTGPVSLDFSARQGWTINKVRGALNQIFITQRESGAWLPASNASGRISPKRLLLDGSTFGATVGYNPFSWWSHQLNVGGDASNTESLSVGVGFSSPSDTSKFNNQAFNSKISESYSSTLSLNILSLSQINLTYGADHWRNTKSNIGWVKTLDGLITSPSIERVHPEKNSGAFVQTQVGFRDALFLTYGVRADWNPNYGERAKVRPGRYGISYSKELGTVSAKIRGSYGRSIKPPALGNREGAEVIPISTGNTAVLANFGSPLYQRLPNLELGPEFQQGGEGGVELYFGRRGSIVVTRYNQTVDGLINTVSGVDSVRALQPGFGPVASNPGCDASSSVATNLLRSDGYCYYVQSQTLNVGSLRNQGWELTGNVNTGPFTTKGTYSWAKSRVIGITQRYRSLLTNQAFIPGQTFNFVPEHTWAVDVSYASAGTSIVLNVNGLGESFREASSGDLGLLASSSLRLRAQDSYSFSSVLTGGLLRLPVAGYTTANLNGSHRFSRNIDATLQITNLTNYYQNDYKFDTPTVGRQTRAGIRILWQ